MEWRKEQHFLEIDCVHVRPFPDDNDVKLYRLLINFLVCVCFRELMFGCRETRMNELF